MHYISAANRQRSRQFDAVIEATVGVLEHPAVREELGAYGAHLLVAANGLVLPNFHHNRVKYPKKFRESNSFGLVPLRRIEQNAGLRMDVSMYEPTQRRRARSSEEKVRQASHFIAEQQPRSPIVTAPGHTNAVVYAEAQYVSRPIIFLHPFMVEGAISPSRGRTVLHELVHADDADLLEDYDGVGSIESIAKDEGHAYCVEGAAERVMEGFVSTDFNSLSKPLKVEAMFAQYGNPSTPPQELIEMMEDYMII